jgi:hypothetical protein
VTLNEKVFIAPLPSYTGYKSKQVTARRGTMRNVYVLEECRTTLASVIKTVHYNNAFVITRHRCQLIAFRVLIDYMPVKKLFISYLIFLGFCFAPLFSGRG